MDPHPDRGKGHADRGNEIVFVCITFLTMTWIAVLLRCFVRIHLLKSFKTDDWLIVIAELIFVLTIGLLFAGVKNGLGRHNVDVPIEPRIQAIKYQAIATITYTAVMAFVKLSVGFFLLRITIDRRYTYTIIVSMIVVGIWTVGIFFFNLFQCKPIRYQWDTRIPGTCVSPSSYIIATFAYSVLSIITDWFYALIPIPMVWAIISDTKTKILVSLPLMFGIFASIATIVRIKFLADVLDYDDILWSPTDTMIWTIIEPGIAITAASIATMRPLFREIANGNFFFNTDGVYNIEELPRNHDPKRKRRKKRSELTGISTMPSAIFQTNDLEGGQTLPADNDPTVQHVEGNEWICHPTTAALIAAISQGRDVSFPATPASATFQDEEITGRSEGRSEEYFAEIPIVFDNQ